MDVRVMELLKNLKFLFITFVFVYVIAVGLFMQFILVPYFFPHANYKYGILAGQDTVLFHEEAVRIAKEIESKGWQAWSLHPEPHKQVMIGITSFLYAITGIHKPYIMLIYNAIMHALFALFLVKLLENLGVKTKFAIFGALPAVFFPITLGWITQIHREGLYILGFILLFWSISEALKGSMKGLIFSILGQAIGVGFVFLARPHIVSAIRYIFAFMIVLAFVFIGFYLLRKNIKTKTIGYYLVFSIVVFAYSSLLSSIPIKSSVLDMIAYAERKATEVEVVETKSTETKANGTETAKTETVEAKTTETKVSKTETAETETSKVKTVETETVEAKTAETKTVETELAETKTQEERFRWTHQFFVPKKIDNILLSMAVWRLEFLGYNTPGNIEQDFVPNKATDFLVYVPRGLFVGLFLGPDFWFYWFVKGGTVTGLFTRYVAPTETIIIFLALLSFPIAFYKLRKNPAFYIILLLCLVFIYLHVITEPNAGTIARKRYVFVSFIVSLSFAYLLMWWFSWRTKRVV